MSSPTSTLVMLSEVTSPSVRLGSDLSLRRKWFDQISRIMLETPTFSPVLLESLGKCWSPFAVHGGLQYIITSSLHCHYIIIMLPHYITMWVTSSHAGNLCVNTQLDPKPKTVNWYQPFWGGLGTRLDSKLAEMLITNLWQRGSPASELTSFSAGVSDPWPGLPGQTTLNPGRKKAIKRDTHIFWAIYKTMYK